VAHELGERDVVEFSRGTTRGDVRIDERTGAGQLTAELVGELERGGGQFELRRADRGLVPIDQGHHMTVARQQIAFVVVAVQGLRTRRRGEGGQPAVQVRVG
jgi:hypothetical protein